MQSVCVYASNSVHAYQITGNWLCQYHLAAIDGGIAAAPGVTRTAVLFVLFIEGRGANGLAARMLPTGKPADSSGKEMLV